MSVGLSDLRERPVSRTQLFRVSRFSLPFSCPYFISFVSSLLRTVLSGSEAAVNPAKQGTKVGAHYHVNVAAGQSALVRLRLSSRSLDQKDKPVGKNHPVDCRYFEKVFHGAPRGDYFNCIVTEISR
jgi:hypothetical protein